MSHRVLVLPSPPTANGDLHLGHLAGPYLGADAFARYRRMQGHDVAYVTGADVHQSYVVRMAERLGTTPQAISDRFAGRIEETLRAADIEVTAFVRPHRSATYQHFVQEFFRRLRDEGSLVDEERPVLWCESCARHLLGAAVRGTCGHCGSGCDGALCEQCGHPVSATELHGAHCARCSAPATHRVMRRLFFPVERFAARLREYHSEARMRPHSKQIVDALLDGNLFDAAITSPGSWGVPMPVPGFEDQRLDVWAEVGPGYPASTAQLTDGRDGSDRWREYWCSEDSEIVEFFGFDNTVPHTLLYPAFYFAHGDIRPPDRFVINEFHRLDGEKFSTSRGHAVWGGAILGMAPADVVRYYLCLTAPEEEQGNFTLAGFMDTVNSDLAGMIGPLLDDLIAASTHDGPSGPWEQTDHGVIGALSDRARELGNMLEPQTFSLRGAMAAWRDMAAFVEKSFERVSDRSGSVPTPDRKSLVEALSILAGCAQPLMPAFARRLWEALGAKDDLSSHPWGEPVRRLGRNVRPPAANTWFPAITQSQLDSLEGEMVAT